VQQRGIQFKAAIIGHFRYDMWSDGYTRVKTDKYEPILCGYKGQVVGRCCCCISLACCSRRHWLSTCSTLFCCCSFRWWDDRARHLVPTCSSGVWRSRLSSCCQHGRWPTSLYILCMC